MYGDRRTVNLGIIGAGFIGQVAHLANYAFISDCRLVALAELRPELRQRVARKYDISTTYASHGELLEDDRVDAVVVVTARPFTGPVALDCLNAGKHVLTEKPMAGDVEQAELLANTARDRGVHYVVGYMKRYDDGVQRAKQIFDELLRTEELGRVVYVRGHCFMGESYCNVDDYISTDESVPTDIPRWPEAPRSLSTELHGDYAWFLNVYSHNTNLLRYFLGGTPELRHAHIPSRCGGVVVFDFQGIPVTLEVGQSSYRDWDEVIEIYFEHGRLRVKTPPALLRNVPAKVTLYRGDTHTLIEPQCEWRWSFRRQAEAFIRTIREDVESLSTGLDSVDDVRLAEMIWRSVEQQYSESICGGNV